MAQFSRCHELRTFLHRLVYTLQPPHYLSRSVPISSDLKSLSHCDPKSLQITWRVFILQDFNFLSNQAQRLHGTNEIPACTSFYLVTKRTCPTDVDIRAGILLQATLHSYYCHLSQGFSHRHRFSSVLGGYIFINESANPRSAVQVQSHGAAKPYVQGKSSSSGICR